MKKILIISIATIIFSSVVGRLYASDVNIQNINSKYQKLTSGKDYSQNSVIVSSKSKNFDGAKVINVNNNIKIVDKPKNENYKTFLTSLIANKSVSSVSPNYIRHFASLPNNVDINLQKNLFDINAPVVDNSGFSQSLGGSSNIKVAVLDSGVEYQTYTNPLTGTTYSQSPALSQTNIVDPYNALAQYQGDTQDLYDPYDSVGHGTFVTGVIASGTNNDASGSQEYGVAGIAFNVSIMPIKVGNSSGIPLSAELLGIQWAINNHANIINMSFTGSTPNTQEENMVEQAISDGIIVVASSGNEGTSSIDYPAGYPNVIAVGATNSQNALTSYSNYGCSSLGNCQTLVAPVGYNNPLVYQQSYAGFGSGSVSGYSNFANQYAAGTSFSAPQVTAAVALYESKYGIQPLNVIENALEQSSTNIGNANEFGYGLLNVNAMLSQNNGQNNTSAYNILSSSGGVYSEGGIPNYGSMQSINQNYGSVVDISETSNNLGYYILTQNGSVYTFGNAQFYGSMYNISNPPDRNSVAIVPTPNGGGYYILTQDGAVYTFGNAQFYGSLYNIPSSAIPDRNPVAFAITPDGGGYYILTQNGSVYTFGNAQFYGSVYNIPNAPVKTSVTLKVTQNDLGYYLLTQDGAIYTFGNAQFYGSMYNINPSAVPSNIPVDLLLTNDNIGYYILERDGAIYTFGDANYSGSIYGINSVSVSG